MSEAAGRPRRVACVGAGEWVRAYHLPELARLREEGRILLKGIWNRTEEKARELAEEFGVSVIYPSLEALASDADLDGVTVAVHRSIVKDVVLRLASRGRISVLCEKPPGNDAGEAKILAERVPGCNIVAFNRRYAPLNRLYREAVRALGPLHYVECRFLRSGRLYPDFVSSTGIHGVNFLEYLYGDIVRAETRRGLSQENGSSFRLVSLEFTGGLRGSIKFLPDCGMSVERYEAHGRGRSALLYSPMHFTSDEGRIEIWKDGKIEETILGNGEEAAVLTSGYADMYEEFLGLMKRGGPAASTFQNSWKSMLLSERIEKGLSYEKEE